MRRKLTGLILCISLVIQPMAGPYIADAEAAAKVVRVKLSMGAPTSVSFYIDGNYSVAGSSGISLDRQLYTVKLEAGKLGLYCGAAKLMGSAASLRFTQHAATPGRNNFIWMKNATYGYLGYLGDMQFNISSGSIEVINHVYVEDYLYGVVPHEMSNSWPVEALKAQAVAARNYVLGNMSSSGTYDVVDTSSDQVYKGFNAANGNAIAAVDQTAKKVLTYGSSLVQIFYSASNGGWTEIPQHCWSVTTRLPYQIIRQDPYDVANPSSLQEWVAFPKDMTSGAKITYRHSGDAAAVESPKAAAYVNDLALAKVKSLGYASIVRINGFKGITAKTYMDKHDLSDFTGTNPCVMFKDADIALGVIAKKSDDTQETIDITVTVDMTRLAEDGGPYQAFSEPMTRLRMLAVEDAGTEFRICHRRYGHGIGLSQRGAQQRANTADAAVNTYDKILDFYFPNTALTAQTYDRPALTAITPADTSNAAIVNTDTTLNIRSSPDSSGSGNIIGALPNAARICIMAANAAPGWHKIAYGSGNAYVSAAYVRIDAGAVIPPPTATPTPPPTSPGGPKRGDVNGDGVISISDYTLIRLDILGLKALTGDSRTAADVNGDGIISISDYTLVRLDILGLKKIS